MDAAHLEDAVGVVGDGAVSIHRQDEAGGGQQPQSGQRDTVELQRQRFVENHHVPRLSLAAIISSAQTEDSRPSARPDRMRVAGPVLAAVAHFGDGPLIGMGKVVGQP